MCVRPQGDRGRPGGRSTGSFPRFQATRGRVFATRTTLTPRPTGETLSKASIGIRPRIRTVNRSFWYNSTRLTADFIRMTTHAKSQSSNTIAIAYLHASKDEQRLSPEAQRTSVEAWGNREGVTVAAVFTDQGVLVSRPSSSVPVSAPLFPRCVNTKPASSLSPEWTGSDGTQSSSR